MEQIKVSHGSEDYFALAASDPRPASALAVGSAVTVVWGDIAYQVVGPDEIVAQVPVTTTTATTVPATAPPGTTAAPDTTPSDNSGFVILLGLVIFVGAVVTIILKGRKSAVRN